MSKETETDHIFEKITYVFLSGTCKVARKCETGGPARPGGSRPGSALPSYGPAQELKAALPTQKICLDRWAGNSWLGRDGPGRVVWVVPCHSGYVVYTMYQEVGLGCTDSNPVTTEVARTL